MLAGTCRDFREMCLSRVISFDDSRLIDKEFLLALDQDTALSLIAQQP